LTPLNVMVPTMGMYLSFPMVTTHQNISEYTYQSISGSFWALQAPKVLDKLVEDTTKLPPPN
jgi:hypothetical protein